eukprot:2128691-Rhodomonas_salina.3
MSGTDRAYTATRRDTAARQVVQVRRYSAKSNAFNCESRAVCTTLVLRHAAIAYNTFLPALPIGLRSRYAVSGSDVAGGTGATFLSPFYSTSRTSRKRPSASK